MKSKLLILCLVLTVAAPDLMVLAQSMPVQTVAVEKALGWDNSRQNAFVTALARDGQNTIWAATEHGIYRYRPQVEVGPKWLAYDAGEGLMAENQVDNTVSFTARNGSTPGTSVMIFTRDPFTVPGSGGQSNTIAREVLATTPTSIEVDRIGVEIPEFSGVKLVSDNSGYQASTNLIETGYGNLTNGSDGGAFVEFVRPIQGSRTVPLYEAFGSTNTWAAYSEYWFASHVNMPANNTFQLLTARQNSGPPFADVLGLTRHEENFSTVFTRSSTAVFSAVTNSETVVHDLGHQFALVGGTNGHVDRQVNALNIEGTDQCIMSYNQIVGSGHVKFDDLCYYTIRDIGVPQ